MKRWLVFLLAIFMPLVAMGGGIDNRYYVTDEMWATEPYNKFVYFEAGFGSCSAQYIAPNLILTAGHCAYYVAKATNYKKQKFDLQLVYNRHKEEDFGIEDWAVYLVKKSKYYSDTFFEPEKITQQTDLLHAGWGWVRILTDDEINTIMNLLESEVGEKAERMGLDEVSKVLKAKMKERGIEQFRDKKNRLKASMCHSIGLSKLSGENCGDFYDRKCHPLYEKRWECIDECEGTYETCQEQCKDFEMLIDDCMEEYDYCMKYPDIIAYTCTTWQGDSGGGFVSDDKSNKLYGVASYHDGFGFEPMRYMASSWQFDEKIRKLREIYSTSNSDKENVKKAKQNTQRVQDFLKNGGKLEDLDVYDVIDKPTEMDGTTNESEESDETEEITSQEIKEQFEMLSNDIRQTESDVLEQLKNIKSLGQNAKLKLIDNIVAYEVKTEQLQELQKAYEDALAREQSLPNRLLSAAAIGATGIGGAMLGAGLAEQRADAAAERDMTAYIETMRCEYANGKTVRGGETNVELPGGNELVALYTEYAELANSLKMRKGELGMSPGIESEIVIDKSDTGLYDNAGVGIVGGGYASVYRALTNPDGADAKMWAEQKDKTAQKIKVGGIVAAAGAVGGLIGNVAINGFDGNGWKKATEETNKNK